MAEDETLTGTGALPYAPSGGVGDLPDGYLQPDLLARNRTREATDEEVHALMESATEQSETPQPSRRERLLANLAKGRATLATKRAKGKKNGAVLRKSAGKNDQAVSSERVNSEEGRQGRADAEPGERGPERVDTPLPGVPPSGDTDQGQLQEMGAVRDAATGSPWNVDFDWFAETAEYADAERAYNMLYEDVVKVGKLVQQRRDAMHSNTCNFCKSPFGREGHFGRYAYEDPRGSGIWHAVQTCRNANCVEQYQNAVNKIGQALKR